MNMDHILSVASSTVRKAQVAFCRFITANDVGATGAHQAGFYIPKHAWSLAFDNPAERGSNSDKFVTIRWQNDFETASRFIYYGVGTRNEYRLTRFGKGFPFLNDDHIGDLLVLCKMSHDFYEGFVLTGDEVIDSFMATFELSPLDLDKLINLEADAESTLLTCFENFVEHVVEEFPPTHLLAQAARDCHIAAFGEWVTADPDTQLLKWIEAEFSLFKVFEKNRYKPLLQQPFQTVDQLVETANSILNRRKSRAGKSLEHHLAEIFRRSSIPFDNQVITELQKKPDFIFPGRNEYHDRKFNAEKLVFLASKTTCKDRWRQIINEADRIPLKHLFTLQQGISANQISEMEANGVQLVVPKAHIKSFPRHHQQNLLTLNDFLHKVKVKIGA